MHQRPRILTPAKAERLRRKAQEKRLEKRKFVVQVCLIAVLMAGAVVTDLFFIRWQKHQRHLRHQERLSLTNSAANTNQSPPQ